MTARRRMNLAALALKGAVALALVALPLPAQAATGDPEIKEFTVKPGVVCPQPAPGTAPTCQAGGHQRLDIHMRFCDPFNGDHLTEGCTLEQLGSHLSDFTLRLPPGL